MIMQTAFLAAFLNVSDAQPLQATLAGPIDETPIILAHGGGTDSRGCHMDRKKKKQHCHGKPSSKKSKSSGSSKSGKSSTKSKK